MFVTNEGESAMGSFGLSTWWDELAKSPFCSLASIHVIAMTYYLYCVQFQVKHLDILHSCIISNHFNSPSKSVILIPFRAKEIKIKVTLWSLLIIQIILCNNSNFGSWKPHLMFCSCYVWTMDWRGCVYCLGIQVDWVATISNKESRHAWEKRNLWGWIVHSSLMFIPEMTFLAATHNSLASPGYMAVTKHAVKMSSESVTFYVYLLHVQTQITRITPRQHWQERCVAW